MIQFSIQGEVFYMMNWIGFQLDIFVLPMYHAKISRKFPDMYVNHPNPLLMTTPFPCPFPHSVYHECHRNIILLP